MSTLDRCDLLDFHDLLIVLDDIKYGERPAYMEAVHRRRMGVIEFFLVPPGIGIISQVQDLFYGDAPAFPGQLL